MRKRFGRKGWLLALFCCSIVCVLFWRWLVARPYAASLSVAPPPALAPAFTASLAVDAGTPEPTDAASPAPAVARPPSPRTVTLATPNLGLETENMLLVGFDRHGDFKRGGSTDTLVVAAFDAGSGHLGLVSVPRDLYVFVPELGETRINAVYGLARLNGEDPLALLERVVGDTLGLPIHHSVAIDLQVFEWAVDAVSGVDVAVLCPIEDDFVDPRTKSGRRALKVEAGLQHMDGITASMFVRSRHGRSDFSRARRQQAVLLALRRKLVTLHGAAELPSLLESVEGSLVTRMSRLELLSWARRALSLRETDLHGVVLGHREMRGFRTERGWSVLLADSSAVETRLQGLFSAPAPGTRSGAGPCPPRDVALTHRKPRPRRKHEAPGPASTGATPGRAANLE